MDALTATRNLRDKAGFSQTQAETMVDCMAKFNAEHLATKADLAEMARFNAEHLATKADLAELEARLTWRIVLAMGLLGGVLGAYMTFLKFFAS